MGFTGFMYMECFPGQSGLQTLLAAQGRFWGKPCLEASWALECCYWYWWGKEHHSSQPDQSHWKSEKEVYWIQKPWHSSKTLPSKVIPQTLPLAARRVWGPDSVCTQDRDQFLQEQLFMKSTLIKSTLSCMPKVDRSWCVSWPVGFEGIHTNDGISGILPTDIRQNSLACHPTGHPKYPKSRWANRILHCHLAKWNFPPIHWNYFNQHQPRTNNHVEGWHSRMKKVISKPHPNIYTWIEYIQREEAVTKAKI